MMETQQFKDLMSEKSAEEIDELVFKIKALKSYYRCAMLEIKTKKTPIGVKTGLPQSLLCGKEEGQHCK